MWILCTYIEGKLLHNHLSGMAYYQKGLNSGINTDQGDLYTKS